MSDPTPLTPDGVLQLVQEFADEDAFLCDFAGVISINAPNIDRVIAISTTPAPLDLLDAITAETTLPPKPTQYRRGWADAHARIAALIRVQSKP